MAKPITTLLFDFDGTLLDTNELIIQTFQFVFDKHCPGKYERKDLLPFLGPTLVETFSSEIRKKWTSLLRNIESGIC